MDELCEVCDFEMGFSIIYIWLFIGVGEVWFY